MRQASSVCRVAFSELPINQVLFLKLRLFVRTVYDFYNTQIQEANLSSENN